MKTSKTVQKLKGIIKQAEAEMKKMRSNLKKLIAREAKTIKAAGKKKGKKSGKKAGKSKGRRTAK